MAKSVKFSDDTLVKDARAVARLHNRSLEEQIAHWARIGRGVEASGSFDYSKIEQALAAKTDTTTLTAIEKAVWSERFLAALSDPSPDETAYFEELRDSEKAVNLDATEPPPMNTERFADRVLARRPDVAALYRKHDAKRQVALALRGLRKKRGLTQAEIATQSGMAQPMVSRAESPSGSLPSLDVLRRYAAACDTDLVLGFTSQTVASEDDPCPSSGLISAVRLASPKP